jgi:hypothetical protein
LAPRTLSSDCGMITLLKSGATPGYGTVTRLS